MGWRDNLRAASFRGVPFLYSETMTPVGRRNVLHEYPLRDHPYGEDLGRLARRYTIEGFVLGDAYQSAMWALIDALEAPGVGHLVHPTLGEADVIVVGATVRENFEREGGYASFDLTFGEAGDITAPIVSPDTSAIADRASTDVGSAVEDDFIDTFRLDGSTWNAITLARSAVADVSALVKLIGGFVAMIDNATALAGATRSGAAKIADVPGLTLAASLAGVSASLPVLMRTPASLAGAVAGVVRGFRGTSSGFWSAITDAVPGPGSAVGGKTVFSALPAAGAVATAATANRVALSALVRRTALVEAARSVASTFYDTSAAALAARDDLAARIDAETLVSSATLNAAWRDLRSAIVDDVAVRAANLPALSIYTPSAVLPAVVLAARLHDDPNRASEIVTRNALARSGFVPVEALEVLSE